MTSTGYNHGTLVIASGKIARVVGPVLSLLSGALLLLLAQQEAAAMEARKELDQAAAACLAQAANLSLGAPLKYTRNKLRAGQPLTVVALGSSSTTGFGTFGKGTAFPDVMERELMRLEPAAQIRVLNRGRAMETLVDNIARLDTDVLSDVPDLVIWQVGTNEVVWRGIAPNATELLANSIGRIKAAKADVILLDLQYAPLVLATDRHVQMESIIADVAHQQNVGLFPRFLLMKQANAAGVSGLVSWDGLHNSASGYACIGIALAQMIDDMVRGPEK
jgi:acyl-CoA thioesterase-1